MKSSAFKLLAVSLIFLFVTIGLLAYVLYGQMKEGERLRSFRQNIEAWDRLNRASADLNDNESGFSDKERLAATVLKSEDDTIAFLAYVDDIAKEAGVEVSTSELKKEKTSEAGFDNIAARMTLRGTPEGVESMIVLLDALPYRSEIKTLTLARLNGSSEAVIEMLISVIE